MGLKMYYFGLPRDYSKIRVAAYWKHPSIASFRWVLYVAEHWDELSNIEKDDLLKRFETVRNDFSTDIMNNHDYINYMANTIRAGMFCVSPRVLKAWPNATLTNFYIQLNLQLPSANTRPEKRREVLAKYIRDNWCIICASYKFIPDKLLRLNPTQAKDAFYASGAADRKHYSDLYSGNAGEIHLPVPGNIGDDDAAELVGHILYSFYHLKKYEATRKAFLQKMLSRKEDGEKYPHLFRDYNDVIVFVSKHFSHWRLKRASLEEDEAFRRSYIPVSLRAAVDIEPVFNAESNPRNRQCDSTEPLKEDEDIEEDKSVENITERKKHNIPLENNRELENKISNKKLRLREGAYVGRREFTGYRETPAINETEKRMSAVGWSKQDYATMANYVKFQANFTREKYDASDSKFDPVVEYMITSAKHDVANGHALNYKVQCMLAQMEAEERRQEVYRQRGESARDRQPTGTKTTKKRESEKEESKENSKKVAKGSVNDVVQEWRKGLDAIDTARVLAVALNNRAMAFNYYDCVNYTNRLNDAIAPVSARAKEYAEIFTRCESEALTPGMLFMVCQPSDIPDELINQELCPTWNLIVHGHAIALYECIRRENQFEFTAAYVELILEPTLYVEASKQPPNKTYTKVLSAGELFIVPKDSETFKKRFRSLSKLQNSRFVFKKQGKDTKDPPVRQPSGANSRSRSMSNQDRNTKSTGRNQESQSRGRQAKVNRSNLAGNSIVEPSVVSRYEMRLEIITKWQEAEDKKREAEKAERNKMLMALQKEQAKEREALRQELVQREARRDQEESRKTDLLNKMLQDITSKIDAKTTTQHINNIENRVSATLAARPTASGPGGVLNEATEIDAPLILRTQTDSSRAVHYDRNGSSFTDSKNGHLFQKSIDENFVLPRQFTTKVAQ